MFYQSFIVLTIFTWQLISISCGPLQDYVKCRFDNNISSADVARFHALQLPETQEGKCYVACVMKIVGLMNPIGTIDPNQTIDLGRRFAPDPRKLIRMETVVVECGDEANGVGENDECNTSFLFMKCALQRRENARFTRENLTLPELNITLPPLTFVLAMLSLL